MSSMLKLTAERDCELTLADGRTLTYALLGDLAGGETVIVLDGPGSRGLARAAAPAAERRGIRLVAPDRPGFGGSTPKDGRGFGDVAADLRALADELGCERFGVLAQSGGTPYALALAAAAPERVSHVVFSGGISPLGEPDALEDVGPPMRAAFQLGRRAPWLLGLVARGASGSVRRDPEKAAAKFVADAPALDKRVLADPRCWELHVVSGQEAVSSPRAFAHELRLLCRPWDIDLSAIRAPVAFWVGALDTTHPPVMSRRMAARLGDAPVTVVPGAGTFGMIDHMDEILAFAV